MDGSETDDESLVGEACHIVAQKAEGPRGISPLTSEQRDKFANLVLLCNVHHKLVDDQANTYSVDRLQTIKDAHIRWVREQLDFDPRRQRDDETYADYIEHWEASVQLNDWIVWTSSVLSNGQPSLSTEMKLALEEVRPWLLSRIWPKRYPELEAALTNFRLVTQDFCSVFNKYAERAGDDEWQTRKFYNIDEWNEERYHRLLRQFEEHVALVEDLMLELTRATNFVCDMVREHILPSFRVKEGVALIQAGPFSDLTFKTYRVEYSPSERISRPYPGLPGFASVRFTRDFCFGEEPDVA